jgi:glycerol uptake facilitator-like aquaporin
MKAGFSQSNIFGIITKKNYSDNFTSRDPMIAALLIGISYFAMEHTMRSISGGPMNPTIALA